MDKSIPPQETSIVADHEHIKAILQELVQKELGWTQDIPSENLSAHLDSIQRLNLLVCIEDHFEIAFEEEEDHSINTLEQLLDMIHTKISQKTENQEQNREQK